MQVKQRSGCVDACGIPVSDVLATCTVVMVEMKHYNM